MPNLGSTYSEKLDGPRLNTQRDRVFHAMSDGQWWTLHQLADAADGSEASVSARIRDLRKPEYGAYNVEHQRIRRGLWRYRLILPDAQQLELPV